MTTIAYANGVLASDSQMTSCDGLFAGSMRKIGKRGAVMYGATGTTSWIHTFLAWADHGFCGEPPRSEKDEDKASGFAIVGDMVHEWFPDGRFTRTKIDTFADGSGAKIAYGAMAAGASPAEAVAAAIKFDIYSGGEIMVLHR
jgi:hypothetical protein